MRIGLFTDTYRPSINGITFVVESLKNQLEALGHEVYVFCPAHSIRPDQQTGLVAEDNHIIRFRSVRSGFFDDFDISLIFPPLALRQIADMQLDIVHVFTPSQVGLLGINAAVRNDIPFIIQHCTDLYEFVENYPNVLPGILALIGIIFPASIKLSRKDMREIAKLYVPQRGVTQWSRNIIAKSITLLHSKADMVIALCPKSYDQLKGWQDADYTYPLTLMPNGVNAIPKATPEQLTAFRDRWGLRKTDEVYGFVGRLGEEKNLDILIKSFDHVGKKRPHAKLLFVGDFGYRATLEAMAAASKFPDRIIFTGAMPREQLGVAYAALDVFAFPSLKDTQGWVLHEAAHARLPIVLIDQGVSEVVRGGENGYFARNNATDFARKVTQLLASPTTRARFGTRSKELAARYTEKRQIKKLEKLYQDVITRHPKRTILTVKTTTLKRVVALLDQARRAAAKRFPSDQ